jgi:type VI protein secretion system component Hcp
LTLYVRIENVMDKESVFIAWDHNGTNVKYLAYTLKGVYVLDVSNLPEDLLYKDIPTKFHVYNTHDYFDTI